MSIEYPFCHMVISLTILPAAITRTIIFPGSLLNGFAAIGGMLTLWIGASLAWGGWCSWACSSAGSTKASPPAPQAGDLELIDRKWTYLSFAVLAVRRAYVGGDAHAHLLRVALPLQDGDRICQGPVPPDRSRP